MNILETKAYQQAFVRYLRKGTPINLSLKELAQDWAYKKLGTGTHYIWRTRDDGKVRASHAANDDKIFAWDNPPPTGNPGEDFNCRCWAEPLNGEFHADQKLITAIRDNPDKWTDVDFVQHYRNGGADVTLEETGHCGEVINHFAYRVITSDGSRGGYQAVEKQIISRAKEVIEGRVDYGFNRTYPFGSYWDLVLQNGRYSLGESTIIGNFDGDVRKQNVGEREYLVINGIMNYEFKDEFSDPYERVERIQILYGVSREEAERIVGDSADEDGTPYAIVGRWQTKLNGTVRIK